MFQEAWSFAKECRADLLRLWLVLLGAVILVNLRLWPEYERGLMTGLLLMAGLAMTLWLVWYASGLGPRLEGTWAEDWTADELKKASNVLETVRNVRFESFDVDNVAIARDGVYVIEVKRHRHFYAGVLEGDLAQFAKNSRTVRNFLARAVKTTSAPAEHAITPVLVVWGRAGLDILPTFQPTSTGDVVLVGGKHLRDWLEAQRGGYFGPDYAHDLAEELRHVARQREEHHAPDSRLIRWLARTR